MAAAVCVAASLSAGAVELGPPPGAALSREKLSSIDDFINGEIASGRIRGAIVLAQRHGQPVYFKCFGKRDVETATPMTADAIFPIHSVTVYLLHYIFIIWLQYAVYDFSLPAGVKFAIVFAGTLAMSWALTVMLRKIPVVARVI
jgi:hypothetical protein